ncbi:MAG TPA: hypothetical protein VFJ47_13540 [Terriglobales bacterium]|nr:hypothetical protein [Terriglobales bacterium]
MAAQERGNRRLGDLAERIASVDTEELADQALEYGERIQSGITDIARQTRSQLRRLNVDETTVPDAFRKAPKFISPRVHRWLDIAVTGYFLGLGVWFAIRGKGGAATAAFVNGGMVAGVSMFTDYEGTGRKPINFKLHGTLDAAQATTAALAPILHGFAGEPESAYFYGQAANEVAVIAGTDWDEGMPARRRRKAA